MKDVFVIKKDGTKEKWSRSKLMTAINKAGIRTRSYIYSDETVLQQKERQMLYGLIEKKVLACRMKEIPTEVLHSFIIDALDVVAPDISKVYKDYHNFRVKEAAEYEAVMRNIENLSANGNLDNANSDAMLVATQNNLAACYVEQSRLENYFLTSEEKKAFKKGFVYLHDKDHRMLYPFNCDLFLIDNLMDNGFAINGMSYYRPKTVQALLAELKDTVLSSTAAQYGGYTLVRFEALIAKYAKIEFNNKFPKKLEKDIEKFKTVVKRDPTDEELKDIEKQARKEITDNILYDIKQGYQGIEYGFNTIASSRGDFPFTTISLGNTLYGDFWAEKVVDIILDVRMKGQGPEGKKKPVIFPKLCFLYDETLHGKGMPYEHLYKKAIKCSSVAMYPDYISLTGYGYISDIYTRYNGLERVFDKTGREVVEVKIKDGYLDGRLVPLDDPRRKEAKYSHGNPQVAISSMGCRSFLSAWYPHSEKNIKTKIRDVSNLSKDEFEVFKPTKMGYVRYKDLKTGYVYTTDTKDHGYPIFEEEVPIYEGRQNNGVITLNLPLIFQYCRSENKNFYDVLSYYMEMIRKLHIRSIEFNGKKKASINPYAFMYGGLIDSDGKPAHKKPTDNIASVLSCGTTSFGITALNELQLLYNGQTIRQAMEEKRESEKKYGIGNKNVKIPFCEKVVDFINNKISEYKDEDDILHSLYGTPAEKLSGTQMEQFKKAYPNIKVKGFTDNTWVSNSFHIHVSEDITPSEKQDLEFDLFHKVNGGHIQYVRINGSYNINAIEDIVRRGMRLGFYQGVNMDLSFCDDCGFNFDSHNMKICECPKCKSKKISTAERICGYLGWTRRGEFYEEDEKGNVIHNGNRVNLPMVDNIKARKCM